MNNWKKVWENREIKNSDETILGKLISVDGFDTGYGTIIEKDWLEYIEKISNKLKINDNDSIYEVGCGAGAFLYGFYKKNQKVGGLDYSEKLISIARDNIKNSTFIVDEAINLDVDEKYDFVLSNSVFFYFKSLDYAEKVIIKMMEKSRKGVAILEVNDLSKRDESIKIRKGYQSEEEYLKKYEGLDHLYYSREWFENLGKKLGAKVIIEQQDINNYKNNEYRFNVYMYKDL